MGQNQSPNVEKTDKMSNNINWVGEIFRHKEHNDLFIVVYHGKNFVVYKTFSLTRHSNVLIGEDDMSCDTAKWFDTKEATGLKYYE